MVFAYILIQCRPDVIGKIEELAENSPYVKSCHVTFGRYDIVLFCQIKTADELSDFVLNEIYKVDGILRTETLICTTPTHSYKK